VSDDYDPTADFARSIAECYRAIRERVQAGGPGWGGWPAGVHADAGGQGFTQQPRQGPDSFSPLAAQDRPAPVPSPLHQPSGDLMKYQFMPMFWGDLFANTLHLRALEFGAYLALIGHAWEHQAKIAVVDLQRVARVSNFHWKKICPRLAQFFNTTTDPNNWIHERVLLELTKAAEISNKRKDAALQMHSKSSANALQTPPHTTTTTTIENLSNGKGSEAPTMQVHVNWRDPGVDYRSPPKKKSDTPLQPLPEKLR